MADRGDVKAKALLAKMPTLRVTVATSDQLAEIWARPSDETTEHAAETERYKRELRAALGNIISSEEMIVVIDELHNASQAGTNNQHEALSVVAAKVRSRNFPENQVGQIVTFALAEYNRMIAIIQRERGQR